MTHDEPPWHSGRTAAPNWRTDVGIGRSARRRDGADISGLLSCGFVNLDDPKYVSDNPIVAGGLSPGGVVFAWTTCDVGNWIPLTWMSYEFDASLFGIRADAFHAVNLAWHTANVLLLYAVLRGMTGASALSATVALLFAVHPLHVESVAWISERKDVRHCSSSRHCCFMNATLPDRQSDGWPVSA